MRRLLFTAITCAALLLLPSFLQAQESNPEITGTVAYRERIALPPDAVINIQLLDTSLANIASQTVADVMLNGEGRQVPVPFTLTYDPAKIVPGSRYSVRATIRSGDGMLMFSTTQPYPVLTHGAPSKVNLVLYRVGHGAKPGAAAKNPTPNAPAEPQPAPEAASAKPPEPPSTSKPTPPVAPSRTQDSEKTAEPSASTGDRDANSDNPGTGGQPLVVEPAAAPNSELTSSGSAPQSKDVTAPPAATEEPASPAATPESTPPPTEAAPTTRPTAQQTPPDERPTVPASSEAPAAQADSKPAEAPPATPEQAPPTESATAPSAPGTPAPESNPKEAEPPLPEAPSASKGIESPMPPSADSTGPDAAEPNAPPVPATALTLLANTQWKLIQLNGQDVVIAATQKPVTLAFSPEGRRIAGSAGCNSFLGTYSDERGVLKIHPGNMTMMFCPDPAGSREKKFIAMLRSVDGYRVNGDFLLLTSKGKIVAKFKTNPPL